MSNPAVSRSFDVVVVGGGHAGIEASLASARMGCLTALVTMDIHAIGRMSCNPAIGGTAKGHLVREIDALGGEMGKLADRTGIHFRMLNKSKGPAVWSPRCQNDRDWYSATAVETIVGQPGLSVIQDSLVDVQVKDQQIESVVLGSGETMSCKSLVLCSGTFLNAVMHTGENRIPGGRYGEPASNGLAEKFTSLGFVRGRLKTGTPPRLDIDSIDFSETEEQPPDPDPVPFSFQNRRITNRQISMYLTYTNPGTHELLRTGFSRSPLYTGRIKGIGPRYCPSIEDKISRFTDRERHQIFLEPEGYSSKTVYVNGFSTSLPEDVQREAITTIPGLGKARMIRAGYAVEYDYFPPFQIRHTLETKSITGLYFAGQINGTSGYEEAAGQGLIAGINAALRAGGATEFGLSRSEAYIGVMVDDLINKGTEEPYRIFTSRAEHRLALRQDNADSRLMRKGHALGLVSDLALRRLDEKEQRVEAAMWFLRERRLNPRDAKRLLEEAGSQPTTEPETLFQLLKRPNVTLRALLTHDSISSEGVAAMLLKDRESLEKAEIEVKYEGYLKRQAEHIEMFEKNEHIAFPEEFDFNSIRSLSSEGRERLSRVRPRSLGQAARISGVTVADVSVLLVMLKR